MLDGKTAKIFELLNEITADGRYKVITAEEIVTMLPNDSKLSVDAVRESVKLLSEKEFIKIKYEDDYEFCLCALPKGRLFCETKNDEEVEDFLCKKSYFLASFCGAFSGSALCLTVFIVLYFLLR